VHTEELGWDENNLFPKVTTTTDQPQSGCYLEQQPHPLVLIGGRTQQPLRVEGQQAEGGVVGSPHPHGAGAGRLGGVEHRIAPEEDVVEGVGLAVARVAKDGEDFHLAVPAAEPLQELTLAMNLGGGARVL